MDAAFVLYILGERWHIGLIFPSFFYYPLSLYLPYTGFIHSCAFSLEPVTTALIQIMGPAQARACAVIYRPFLLSFGVGGGFWVTTSSLGIYHYHGHYYYSPFFAGHERDIS